MTLSKSVSDSGEVGDLITSLDRLGRSKNSEEEALACSFSRRSYVWVDCSCVSVFIYGEAYVHQANAGGYVIRELKPSSITLVGSELVRS